MATDQIDTSRFYVNDLPDNETGAVATDFLAMSAKMVNRVVEMVDSPSGSTSSKSLSLYTGTGGVAFMYLRLALSAPARSDVLSGSRHANHACAQAEHCLRRALELTKDKEMSFNNHMVTFLEGAAGCLAIQACVYHSLGQQNESLSKLRILRSLSSRANSLADEECELLYGRAGYLYAVAFCRKVTLNHTFAQEEVRLVIASILRQGLSASPESRATMPFLFEWHRNVYLGAAHGYAGILLTLLLFPDELATAESIVGFAPGGAMQAIENCVQVILTQCRFPSGNIQSSIGSDHDRLVHWCHGAPGWIPMIAKAAEVFPANRDYYMKVLTELGDVVWQRGLLRKGLGLCHGIGGNGLALLSVYRATKDPKWLHRAKQFAIFGINKFDHLLERPQRPHSLFEGISGFALFLSELTHPEASLFPGSEC